MFIAFGLTEEAEKLRERVSPFETAARAGILKDGKSPAARKKREKTENEAEMVQARVKLGAQNA